jgi:hypothetical protein
VAGRVWYRLLLVYGRRPRLAGLRGVPLDEVRVATTANAAAIMPRLGQLLSF